MVQIPFCNQALVTGRWDCFISIEETQRYLNSEQDDLTLNDYFSKRWIVATQVQALIWYKLYLLDVVENGLQIRARNNNVNQDDNNQIQPANRFLLKGEYCEITFNQKTVNLRNTKGIRYIAYLIQNQNKSIHVSELFRAVNPPDTSQTNYTLSCMTEDVLASEGFSLSNLDDNVELLDKKTIEELGLRIEQLNDGMEEAKEFGDFEECERLETDKDRIITYLSANMGLGGKSRTSNNLFEKIRKSIQKRIRVDLIKIHCSSPEFAEHLQTTLKTGMFCEYHNILDLIWVISPF